VAGDAPRRRLHFLPRFAIAVIVAGVAIGGTTPPTGASPRAGTTNGGAVTADRVLVISLPHVSWEDIANAELPNIRRVLQGAALATMTTRTITEANLGSGYLTLGAGTRAAAPNDLTDGAALEVDEEFVGEDAAAVFEQRTALSPTQGIVHLGLAPILDVNDDDEVDVHVGALGDALERAGYSRAVIGNADAMVLGTELESFGRYLAAALMDAEGRVPAGRVDDGLLIDDPQSPFGVRLDPDAVVSAFDDVWEQQSVVLVEASDLARVKAAAPLTEPDRVREQQRVALRRADALVGRLLESVDFERDAVLILSPAPALDGNRLAAVGLHAPGGEAGLLRTASTRRDGYALLADVAPTILDVLGIERARDMQGRRFQLTPDGDSFDARLQGLVDASEEADFRKRTRTAVIYAFVAIQAALGVATILLLRGRVGARVRTVLRYAPLGALAFVPVLYVIRLLPAHEWGFAGYAAALATGTLALALLYRAVARGRVVDELIVGVGTIMGVLVLDVISGAHLQLNSAFGYGPTVGVRIAGFGNVSFAALAASSILLAGLLAHRVAGKRGVIAASAVVAVAVIVDANPAWGSDVGGVLALGVSGVVTVLLLMSREVRLRARVLWIGLGVAVLGLVAATALDFARPADQRTHLGRLVEQITDEGPSVLSNVLVRKLGRNLATAVSSTEWLVMAVIVLAFLAYLFFWSPVRVGRIVERVPTLQAMLIGFAVAAVLGYALNDTGIAVPGVMLGILTPVLVLLLVDRMQSGPPAKKKVSAHRL